MIATHNHLTPTACHLLHVRLRRAVLVMGDEQALIQRSEPVFAVRFSPAVDEPFDVLAVGCWDQVRDMVQL